MIRGTITSGIAEAVAEQLTLYQRLKEWVSEFTDSDRSELVQGYRAVRDFFGDLYVGRKSTVTGPYESRLEAQANLIVAQFVRISELEGLVYDAEKEKEHVAHLGRLDPSDINYLQMRKRHGTWDGVLRGFKTSTERLLDLRISRIESEPLRRIRALIAYEQDNKVDLVHLFEKYYGKLSQK